MGVELGVWLTIEGLVSNAEDINNQTVRSVNKQKV